MNSDIDAIRTLLSPHDPAAGVDPALSGASLTAILNDAPGPDSVRRLWGRRAVMFAGAGVAAVAIVGVAGVVVLPGNGEPGTKARAATPPLLAYHDGGSTRARDVLLRLAERAERQPDTAGTGRYAYVRTRNWALDDQGNAKGEISSAVIAMTSEQWLAADGSGRQRYEWGPPYFPTERDRRLWEKTEKDDGGIVAPGKADHRFGPHGIPFGLAWSTLSDNPETLRKQLYAANPNSDEGQVERLVDIDHLYSEQPIRPAVAAAALRVVADIPGLHYDGTTTDRAARAGVAVSVEWNGSDIPQRYTLIFDPHTGRLLDSEQVLTRAVKGWNVRVPAVISYTVFLKSSFTKSPEPPK
ncbi:CU044_5270 family protein [Actinoallomurus sp. NPDC050550]|uniref:CU044_5270 family protein n=1 Tax=Actinoallomurus sp. NPDC050550 TaxID=3154937 RepID=UPI0034050C22